MREACIEVVPGVRALEEQVACRSMRLKVGHIC